MAEVLRDLVVTLSLQSDNFTRNITSINKQIREAESEFRLAGAGIENYGQTTEGLATRLNTLQKTLGFQKNAVQQYERMLAQANDRLSLSKDRYDEYNKKLEEARKRHDAIRESMEQHENALEELRDLGQENTIWYAEEAATLERISNEYAESGENVSKLEGQVASLQKTMQNAANAEADAETKLNNAKAAVKETESAISSLEKRLKTAQSAWTTAGNALANFSSKAKALGTAMTSIGKSLTLKVTAPIVAFGKSVMQASIDFESTFTSVRKTVDATEEEFAQLAAASKQMSTEIAASTSAINEVMAAGGQLGIQNEHLVDFTRTMIDLGNSCEDLDASAAAEQLAKFANVMDTNQDKFQNIGSVVVDLGNNFATTEAPIVEMAQRLAGAGKQVGLTEAQVLGLSAALSSVGIKAQMGGSSMSKALIKMEVAARTGNDELEDFAKVSGMTAAEFVKTWDKDPVEAFQRFINGVAAMSDEGISAVKTLDDIGIKEIRLRDTLLRSVNAHELFARAQERANKAWEENTALQVEANKRYATLESRLTNVKNKATLFAQTLGNDLRPTLTKLMEGVSDYIDKLMNMDESQRKTLLTVAGIAAAAGPVIFVFGKLVTGISAVGTAMSAFALKVAAVGGGLKGFLAMLAGSPAIWLAVGAAVAYGAYRLIDWASGAKKAREATQALIDTAKEWKETAAETFYGKSDAGLSFFGMSEESFTSSNNKTIASARSWIKGLLEVWTDGKGETNAIVKEWTDSWKSLTDNTRTELQNFYDLATEGGQTEVAEQVQADIDTLNNMDKEVEALLKKRQNGYLSEDEQIHLQDLIDQRDALIVKYKLQPETDNEGFQTILNKVQREVARAQARGEADADVTVYQNAVVAAAQGLAAMNASIDEQYDKERSVIELIKDQGKREEELAKLNERYNTQRQSAARDYAQTLSKVMGPVLESESMKETGDALDNVSAKLTAYDYAVKTYGDNSKQAADALDEVNKAASGLNESDLTEYSAALSQITELLHSGMTVEEVQALFPQIDISKAAEQLASVQEFTKTYSDTLSGLSSMFGEGLAEEVLKIATSLDMTGAQADWAAFAENPGSITTDAIIENVEQKDKEKNAQIKADAVIEKLITTNPESGETELSVHGLIGYVSMYAEETTGASIEELTPGGVTALVNAYDQVDGECDISQLKPDEVTARVQKYLEKDGGADATSLKPDQVEAFVAAYSELKGKNLTEALKPKDITAWVCKYLEDEDGVNIDDLTPDQITGYVSALAKATGMTVDESIGNDITGYITKYDDSKAVLPSPKVKLAVDGFDMATLKEFTENNKVEVKGIIKVGEKFDNPEDVLNDEDATFYINGKQIPVDLVPKEKLTAETIIAYDEDGSLHVLITPELGSTDSLEKTEAAMTEKAVGGGLGVMFSSTSEDVKRILGLVSAIDDLNAKIKELNDSGGADPSVLGALNEQNIGNVEELQTQLNQLDESDIASIGLRISDLMAALDSGTGTPEEITSWENELQGLLSLIESIDPSTTTSTGENIMAGIGQGMAGYSFDSDAATAKEQIVNSINSALGVASPATSMFDTGENVAAGVAEGMKLFDFSAVAAAITTAIQAAIPADLLVDVGTALAAGMGNSMAAVSMSGAAAAVAGNVRTSVGAVLTATTLRPAGQNAGRGVITGLTSVSFSTAASSIASKVKSAVAKDLNSNSLRDAGSNVIRGLADGISSGAGVAAMAARAAAAKVVQAAKDALKISSPSRVFRDEIGVMAMRGFGEGFEKEKLAQARAIRNASKYLTNEAQEGIVTGNVMTDNRATYHQESSVSVTGNTFVIREESDVHKVATEIAALTSRYNAGVGVRKS